MNDERYGFVRNSNVCDVDKLNKAFNNVSFGDFRLFANVARYDRFETCKRRLARNGEGGKINRKFNGKI